MTVGALVQAIVINHNPADLVFEVNPWAHNQVYQTQVYSPPIGGSCSAYIGILNLV
jgi:hypothetical protein